MPHAPADNGYDCSASRPAASTSLKFGLEGTCMSFEKAIEIASRDERFMATVYAINTLLIHKGIYSQEEFEGLFVEWMNKEERKKTRLPKRASHAAFSQA